jgi:hypothetical protein
VYRLCLNIERLIKLRSYLNSEEFKSIKVDSKPNKDTQNEIQDLIMSIISSLKPHTRNVKKEALLKSLDQNLFIRCDTQFRNKMKAAVNDIQNSF